MWDAHSYETAILPSGVHLAYLDSWRGKPSVPSSYTTIIALHGAGFNSGSRCLFFERLAV
jgi:hypothetical protein